MDAVAFHCDWNDAGTPFAHFWEHTVGSGHATLALRSDWQAQLRRCHAELGFRHVRFHGLLCDDMSTLLWREDRLLYSFFNADSIVDFLLGIGMRPFVELSFMPEVLASGPQTVFHYRGNVTPPRHYKSWATLVGKLAAHWVERYGREEVRQWFFEVWNEPNLRQFWTGTQEAYFKLYRDTARALRHVDGRLQVGGPATAKEEWIEEFLTYCRRHKLPVAFVSTHHYPNDVIWREKQPTEDQLAHSRRSLLREGTEKARRQAGGVPLFYTEWNCSSDGRFPLQDEPYAAAFVTKTIMEAAGLVECYSFWTFSDLFEENYFPSVPFHGGFGLLTVHGVPKPTYRAFELLHRLGSERLAVEGLHATVDAWVVRQPGPPPSATVLLTNHALPRHPIRTEKVRVRLTGARRPAAGHVECIDQDHANPKAAWQAMGAPEYLDRQQVEHLEAASRLAREPLVWTAEGGGVQIELELAAHAVAAVTLEFPAGAL